MAGTAITDALIKKITDPVKLGVPPLVAAMQNGVSESEFADWMSRGVDAGRGEWRYAKFRDAIKEAEALCEAGLVGTLRRAAQDGNVTAATWLLERRFPERYVRRSVSTEGKKDPNAADPFADIDNVVDLKARAKRASQA